MSFQTCMTSMFCKTLIKDILKNCFLSKQQWPHWHSLKGHFFQNLFFWVSLSKESLTGLEWETDQEIFIFLCELSPFQTPYMHMHMLYEYLQIHIVNYDELQEHYMHIKVGHVSYMLV